MITEKEINILLVDDHKLVIDGLSSLLHDDTRIRVRGVFTSGLEALAFIGENKSQQLIDIVISDLRMTTGVSGLQFALQLRSISPETKVIILSMSESPDDVRAAIRMGVSGYISKSQDVRDIRKAIHEVMRDSSRTYLSQEILRLFIDLSSPQHPDEIRQLTNRELEILKLIASEHTTSEIADQLFISDATVDTHRRNIIQKLGVKSIVGLTNFAIRHGLV
ncbi:response regulator [Spirosoma fluviale]|uniref:Two component transcriptional regulator, LuxR family n=1 Tax=Spirosoma fluviale TaxID=1597977 RepID=A0A286GVX5_9BACT|nr:response regulator transcription factor [Spirosoma fluviale]SOD99695.1 two component transcriptional regulator, LuxR family [Spirosoma fluviale]